MQWRPSEDAAKERPSLPTAAPGSGTQYACNLLLKDPTYRRPSCARSPHHACNWSSKPCRGIEKIVRICHLCQADMGRSSSVKAAESANISCGVPLRRFPEVGRHDESSTKRGMMCQAEENLQLGNSPLATSSIHREDTFCSVLQSALVPLSCVAV